MCSDKNQFFYFAILMTLIAGPVHGAVINLVDQRASPDTWGASTMDPMTGQYYTRSGGDGFNGVASIRMYANQSDYISNTGSNLGNLDNSGFWGTYFTVKGGKIFARGTSSNSTTISRWDAATGATELTATIPGMGGINGTNSFNWGGFTTMNVMQDQTGIYVVGEQPSGQWQVTKIDQDLNVLGTKTFAQTQANNYGYGFMVNGNLFLGEAYQNGTINTQFDFETGLVTAVSHQLTGQNASNPRFTTMFYDPNLDTLYTQASFTGRILSSAGISATLGVAAVPEPSSLVVLGVGTLGLLVRRRKRT